MELQLITFMWTIAFHLATRTFQTCKRGGQSRPVPDSSSKSTHQRHFCPLNRGAFCWTLGRIRFSFVAARGFSLLWRVGPPRACFCRSSSLSAGPCRSVARRWRICRTTAPRLILGWFLANGRSSRGSPLNAVMSIRSCVTPQSAYWVSLLRSSWVSSLAPVGPVGKWVSELRTSPI